MSPSLENPTRQSSINPPGPHGNTPQVDEYVTSRVGDNIPAIKSAINDVESLKNGIIKSTTNKGKAPYTILLVGETGVGKSSVVELIANVLVAHGSDHYDFSILDHNNESQIHSVRLYEFKSKNGVVVRILDTPGLADARDLQQGALQKKSLAAQVKKHVDSVTAVLVLANGTVPRVNLGTDYALSTLSAIFPKAPSKNVAFMLTNTSDQLYQNFSKDILPEALNHAPQYLLNNPIALQRKYLKLKDEPNMRRKRTYFREAVKASEQDALEMLVDLFDWLDQLEPQPITKAVSLYEQFQCIIAQVTHPLARRAQELQRAIKDKVEAGLWRVNRIFLAS